MQEQHVDAVGPDLAAEAVEVGPHLALRAGFGLGHDHDLVAAERLQGFPGVGVGAVGVGQVPEGEPLVDAGPKELGQAGEPELARLVGAAAKPMGPRALGQPRDA